MICLDTNAVIAALNLRPAVVRSRLDDVVANGVVVGIPAIVLFEMCYGAAKSDRRARNEATLKAFLANVGVTVWAFEPDDAWHAGDIRAHLEKRGSPIGHYDNLIAAQARRRGATLVTANGREFHRVPGLVVVDWAA